MMVVLLAPILTFLLGTYLLVRWP